MSHLKNNYIFGILEPRQLIWYTLKQHSSTFIFDPLITLWGHFQWRTWRGEGTVAPYWYPSVKNELSVNLMLDAKSWHDAVGSVKFSHLEVYHWAFHLSYIWVGNPRFLWYLILEILNLGAIEPKAVFQYRHTHPFLSVKAAQINKRQNWHYQLNSENDFSSNWTLKYCYVCSKSISIAKISSSMAFKGA